MDDYIRRVTVRNALYEADAITMKGVAILNQFPAADVVEVRHGRWIEIEHGENGILCECSTCKEWMLFYYGFVANYCPSCGAKMDGGADE